MAARDSKSQPDVAEDWGVEFFQRHADDDDNEAIPGREFLDAIPETVSARIIAALDAVADAPPPAFSGGGYWQAMHGEMTGYYEVRVKGPRKILYRVFCLLERDGVKVGLNGPSIVVIGGKSKMHGTALSSRDYAEIRRLGDEYRSRTPRRVQQD